MSKVSNKMYKVKEPCLDNSKTGFSQPCVN